MSKYVLNFQAFCFLGIAVACMFGNLVEFGIFFTFMSMLFVGLASRKDKD